MKIVSVSGTCSRAGKTAVAVTLLEALPGAAAVKFTTTDDVFERCPRGTTCIVCDIDVPFRIVTDPRVLAEDGTDTARLLGTGARPVVWAIARRGAAGRAWASVAGLLGERPSVLEGSTIVASLRPALRVFVAHPFLSPDRWKATSAGLARAADLVVVNRPHDEPREPSPAVLAALHGMGAGDRIRVADVTRPVSEWAPELSERLATLAAGPPHAAPARIASA